MKKNLAFALGMAFFGTLVFLAIIVGSPAVFLESRLALARGPVPGWRRRY